MAAEWYYTSNRQQMGPVSWKELCELANSGLLKPTDLIWKDGMADWSRASTQPLFRQEKVAKFVPEGKAEFIPTSRHAEEDERPRRRPSRPDEDDEERDLDEEEDRPRRRRRPQGMPAGVKVGLIIGGVAVVALVVGVTLFFVLKKEPGPGGVQDIPPQGLTFANQSLVVNDPPDKVMRNPCKAYQVAFTANSTYIIEHRSVMFDAFLRLEDPAGVQVALDDDGGRNAGGGMLDSRIIYRANQSGNFRIIATSLDGRLGNFTLTVRKK